jgi:hypothetical protein
LSETIFNLEATCVHIRQQENLLHILKHTAYSLLYFPHKMLFLSEFYFILFFCSNNVFFNAHFINPSATQLFTVCLQMYELWKWGLPTLDFYTISNIIIIIITFLR